MSDKGERVSVVWVQRIERDWWRCWYSPPLEDNPTLLAETYSAESAVQEGLARLQRLEKRNA